MEERPAVGRKVSDGNTYGRLHHFARGLRAAEGWPGWWDMESPEYLGWLGDQAEHTVLMGATT